MNESYLSFFIFHYTHTGNSIFTFKKTWITHYPIFFFMCIDYYYYYYYYYYNEKLCILSMWYSEYTCTFFVFSLLSFWLLLSNNLVIINCCRTIRWCSQNIILGIIAPCHLWPCGTGKMGIKYGAVFMPCLPQRRDNNGKPRGLTRCHPYTILRLLFTDHRKNAPHIREHGISV